MRGASRWLPWLLVAAGLSIYAPALDGPFIYDDEPLLENREIRRLLPPWRAIDASPNSAAAGRPVVHYSLTLNHALGGLEPRGYKLLNLAVHLACALVLYGIVRRTATRSGDEGLARASSGLGASVALLWMLHPLQTECVQYVSQRSESLMGLFYLLTLYASIRALDRAQRGAWIAAAIACCALGMASKEVMVTAPLIVPLYDRVFTGLSARRLLRERGGLYAGLAVCWALLAVLMATGPRASSVGFTLGTGVLEYAANQTRVVTDYLWRVVWPHPLVLDYGYPRTLSAAEVAPCALLLVALLGATAVALVRRPRIGFPAAWTFVILAPTSSLVPIVTEVGAERRMYLPLAGPIVLAVVGGWLLTRRLRTHGKARAAGVALLLLAALPLAWATTRRNHDYRSAVAIWSTSVAARPDNHRAQSNLGKALQRDGRLEEAMARYRHALELRPDHDEAWNNLGTALLAAGRTEEAIEHFRRAIDLRPDYVNARYNLAAALQSRRRLEAAVEEYRLVLRLAPDHHRAHNNLGTALGSQGKLDEAIGHFREALRLAPGYVEARRNLELALIRAGRARPETLR